MTSPFENDAERFDVLCNAEGQYSLWPTRLPVPAGWAAVLHGADRAACAEFIRSVWTDLRPRSLAEVSAVPTGGSLVELFRDQVVRHRDETAIVDGDERLTYGELDARSEDLASTLVALGVAAEDRVAVLLDRSIHLVVAVLAVVKAGAAYVPLPLEAPAARLDLMRERVRFDVVLVDRDSATHPFPRGLTAVRVDEPPPPAQARLPVPHPDHVAYILHTSGSTGRPKGVAITHRTVAAFAADRVWRNDAQRAVLMAAPPIFDGITYEVWIPLLCGGRIIVTPPDVHEAPALAEFIRRSGATAAFLVPFVLNSLVEQDLDALAGLEFVWTAGDVVSRAVLDRLTRRFPHMVVAASWGLTETTVVSTWYPAENLTPADHTVPIGVPMDGTRVHVLDNDLREVPVGGVGEGYVGGIGPAQGYEGAPDLTAERFVADPFGPPGSRLFRTGDLLRTRADGNLDFVGRADRMVKVRGCRVEPAEVEAILARSPAVAQIAVVVPAHPNGEKYLLACVVPAAASAPSTADLRAEAAGLLPGYLVPDEFVLMDTMPLTASGKVDRTALLGLMQAVP